MWRADLMRRLLKIVLCIVLCVVPLTSVMLVNAQTETLEADNPVTVRVTGGGADLQYEATRSEIVTITARSLDGDVDTLLELYSANGTKLADNDDTLTSLPGLSITDSAIVNFTLPAAGEYIIHVTSFGNMDTGDVEVTLTVVGEGSPEARPVVEVDTSLKLLFSTEPLKVYLDGRTPVDLRYVAVGRQTISIYSNGLDNNAEVLDSVLTILDEDGDVLAENDDLTNDTRDAGIENFSLPGAGIYTIRVKTFDGLQSGGVEVRLVAGEGGTDPVETGDCASATINLGDTLTASVSANDGTEFFFCGEAGQIVTITAIATDPPSLTQDLFMSLYDERGNEVASDDDSASINQLDPSIQSIELPADGLYRIEITSIDNLAGEFTISLEEG
jgi:hypothetical protein